MLVQNAFPDFDADQREIVKTGICSKCWTKLARLLNKLIDEKI